MRVSTVFSCLLIATVSCFSLAQEHVEDQLEIRLKSGWFFMNDDFYSEPGNGLERNWSVSGEVIYWFDKNFGLGAEVEYFRTNISLDLQIAGAQQEFQHLSIPINIDLYYRFPDTISGFRPYVGGGLSTVYVKRRNAIPPFLEEQADNLALGLNIVGGFTYGNLLFEAQWLWAEPDLPHSPNIPIVNEENAGGVSIWIGIRF